MMHLFFNVPFNIMYMLFLLHSYNKIFLLYLHDLCKWRKYFHFQKHSRRTYINMCIANSDMTDTFINVPTNTFLAPLHMILKIIYWKPFYRNVKKSTKVNCVWRIMNCMLMVTNNFNILFHKWLEIYCIGR